jgi:hypothetical protein
MAASIAGLRRNLKNVAHNYTEAQVRRPLIRIARRLSGLESVFQIRIRIGSGLNQVSVDPYPDPGGQKWPILKL